eukprot:4651997-Pyramimonas_sp.AAC.1
MRDICSNREAALCSVAEISEADIAEASALLLYSALVICLAHGGRVAAGFVCKRSLTLMASITLMAGDALRILLRIGSRSSKMSRL